MSVSRWEEEGSQVCMRTKWQWFCTDIYIKDKYPKPWKTLKNWDLKAAVLAAALADDGGNWVTSAFDREMMSFLEVSRLFIRGQVYFWAAGEGLVNLQLQDIPSTTSDHNNYQLQFLYVHQGKHCEIYKSRQGRFRFKYNMHLLIYWHI